MDIKVLCFIGLELKSNVWGLQVIAITNGASTDIPVLGSVIPVGSYLQAIGADTSGVIWVSGSNIDDISVQNNVYVIDGLGKVAAVTGLTYATGAGILSGATFL